MDGVLRMCNQCQQYLMRNKIVSHNGHIHIKTLSHNHLKRTTLCIPQHAITLNNKLDASHLLICKTYSCSHKLSAETVQRWIDKLSQLPNCNPIVSYHLQGQHSQQSTATLSIYEKYLRDGNLGELIDEQWQLGWQLIIKLAQSVRELHKEGMYLGALKPENILLDKQQRQISFTDLRMSFAHCITSNQQIIGTNKIMNGQGRDRSDRMSSTFYSAPEIKNGNYYDQAADIYSLGVILFELARHQRMHQLLHNNQLRTSQAGKQHQLERLAARMMKEDMLQRPTIQEVLDELTRIQSGSTHADSFICKQMVALYLPLNFISPKFDIGKTTFREAFSRVISDKVVSFQIDERALFLRSKLQLGAIVLMSVIAEQELGRDIMQYFRSMRELYEYLRGSCNGISLTATAMLRFNYARQQNPSTMRSGNKQSREANNAKQCLVNEMELTSDSTSQEMTPL